MAPEMSLEGFEGPRRHHPPPKDLPSLQAPVQLPSQLTEGALPKPKHGGGTGARQDDEQICVQVEKQDREATCPGASQSRDVERRQRDEAIRRRTFAKSHEPFASFGFVGTCIWAGLAVLMHAMHACLRSPEAYGACNIVETTGRQTSK
ncbi:hypothetical protein CMUS01_05757 [Colletotrichum musicola]|uniref:Uncharacterized protein n=1 Tax=Colletotrichum musicola TaxID=2175873 RepID=A0A8H6NJB4_9PEZI|nr:hypothetical protein CMUS01_05757 [Colletotrichum musicola]